MNETAAPSPLTSDADCSNAIAVIGDIDRALRKIETDKSAAIARATAAAEDKATPLISRRAELEAKVTAYCAKERDRLTRDGETKTVDFASGKVAWRMGRPSVEIDDGLKEKILDALGRIRGFYDRFTTVKTDIAKAKLLAATDAEKVKLGKIRGVRFVPGSEGFSIEPAGGELASRPGATEADA